MVCGIKYKYFLTFQCENTLFISREATKPITSVLGDVFCCASAVICSCGASRELIIPIRVCSWRVEDQEGMGLSKDLVSAAFEVTCFMLPLQDRRHFGALADGLCC